MNGNQSVIAMFNTAGGGATGTWGTPQRIDVPSLFGVFSPVISMNLSGQAIVVWPEWGSSFKASHFAPGLGWSVPKKILENTAFVVGHDVAINADGNGVFVGMGTGTIPGTPKVFANHYIEGQGWGIAQVVGALSNPQVTIDQSGNVFAAWTHTDLVNNRLDFMVNRRAISQEWEAPTIIVSGVGFQSIVSDAAGNAMAVWIGMSGGEGIMSRRFSPEFGWAATEILLEDTPPLRILNFMSGFNIKMNSNGSAVLGFRAIVNFENTLFGDALFVMLYTPGVGWSAPEAVSLEGDIGSSPFDVAISGNGSASILYMRYSGEFTTLDNSSVLTGIWTLYARHYTPVGGWGEEQTIAIGKNGFSGLNPKISMDSNGGTVAVWHSYDGVKSDILASSYVPGAGWQQPQSLQSIEPSSIASFLPVEVEMDGSGRAIAVWGREGIWVSRLE